MSGIEGVGAPKPFVGVTGGLDTPRARVQLRDDSMPPPPTNSRSTSGSVPILSEPKMFDAGELIAQFLSLKTKMGDEQLSASMKDVRFNSEVQKAKNDEIAKKMAEALDKIAQAKSSQLALKIFGWIAVALSVVLAIANGGALAFAAAGLAVTMAVLSEAGVMDKLTEAIADSLVKDGMDPDKAKMAAGFITMGICLAASLATLGAGVAATGAKVAEVATKAMMIAKQVANAAKFGQGVMSVAQGGTQLYAGVKQHEAAESQAEAAEIRKFVAKLQALQDDEMDRIQAMVQALNESTTRAMAILNGQAETSAAIVRHMA
jgi:hypothetical protein